MSRGTDMSGNFGRRREATRRLAVLCLLAGLALPATRSHAQDAGTFVELPNVKLWVTDSGGSGDAVILLHANTGTSEIWQKQIPALVQAGYRVIALDRPGWGKSIVRDSAKPASVAEDLDALADRLQLARFHLVGTAGGGYIAVDYAAWRPERLKSLVV